MGPKYKFKEVETSEEFQLTLRERKLLNAFMSIKIRQASEIRQAVISLRGGRLSGSRSEMLQIASLANLCAKESPPAAQSVDLNPYSLQFLK
jgi:hypothetical protein